MGIGASLSSYLKKQDKASALYVVELIVALIIALAVPTIYFIHGLINIFFAHGKSDLFYGIKAVFLFQIITSLIGFFSGLELPLLMEISSKNKKIQISNSKILGLSYIGALISSYVSIADIPLKNDFTAAGLILGSFALIAASVIFLTNIRQMKMWLIGLLLVPASVNFMLASQKNLINQTFLKEYYVNIKVPAFSFEAAKTILKFFSTVDDVERYETNYQTVDILSDKFMSNYDREGDFSIYLNNQFQFSRRNAETYHESMVLGSLNITQTRPKDILILGGGDGLIADQLSQLDYKVSMTQVELDPQIVELAKHHEVLRSLNHDIYARNVIDLKIGDAFTYIQNCNKKYDAVFIDFPFPTSYDLSKLYSLEFYLSLRKILNQGGFFVFDAPILLAEGVIASKDEAKPQDIILSTLDAAQFKNIFPFGLTDSFYLVSLSDKELKIRYELFPKTIKNKTIVNTYGLKETLEDSKIDAKYVNTIFLPKKFKTK
jgi:spermidine synthase